MIDLFFVILGDTVTDPVNVWIEKVTSTYDGFNRLKSQEKIKDGTRVTVTFLYDGDNLRTQKTVRSSAENYAEKVTRYDYDRQYVILETDANKELSVRYIRGINYIARQDGAGRLSYYLYNGHGVSCIP